MAVSKRKPLLPLYTLRSHDAAVNSVKFISEDKVVTGSGDGCLKIWDLTIRRVCAEVQAHSKKGILKVDILPTGEIISQGRDGWIKIWDPSSFTTEPIRQHQSESHSFCQFSLLKNDEGIPALRNLLVAPCADPAHLTILDYQTLKRVNYLKPPNGSANFGMCMSTVFYTPLGPDTNTEAVSSLESPNLGALDNEHIAIGRSVLAGGGYESGHLVLHDISGGKSAVVAKLHNEPLLATDVFPSSNLILTAGADSRLLQVRLNDRQDSLMLTNEHQLASPGVSAITLRNDGNIFAIAGWDGCARVFQTGNLKPLAALTAHKSSIYAVDFWQNSGLLATASKDTNVVLWSIYPQAAQRNAIRC